MKISLNALSRRIRHHVRYRLATMRHKGCVPAYWYDAANFGDQLTPLLLRHYGLHPVHARPEFSRVAGVGSIVEHLPAAYQGVILGSGCIKASSACALTRARILAVRGPLTLRQMGLEGSNTVMGDPGLLAPRLNFPRQQKKYVLGVVPHYVDREQPAFLKVAERLGARVATIDVRRAPEEVFQAIDECEHIVSSSLHGLITADSLGIPTGWLESPRVLGGRHKFDDYYGALGLTGERSYQLTGEESLQELVALTAPKPAARIDAIVNDLDRVFKEYAAAVLAAG